MGRTPSPDTIRKQASRRRQVWLEERSAFHKGSGSLSGELQHSAAQALSAPAVRPLAAGVNLHRISCSV